MVSILLEVIAKDFIIKKKTPKKKEQTLICLLQLVKVFSRIDKIACCLSGCCCAICARILNAGNGRTTDSTWNVCVAAVWLSKRWNKSKKRSFSRSDTSKLQDNNGR